MQLPKIGGSQRKLRGPGGGGGTQIQNDYPLPNSYVERKW